MAIINNELTSDSAKLRINNPYLYVADPDNAGPLALAYLYFGKPTEDPKEKSRQKKVYVIQEDGSVVGISQPVRTSAGGIPEYNGSPVSLAIDGNYSFLALNSEGEQKLYASKVDNSTLLDAGITGVLENTQKLLNNQRYVTFENIDVNEAIISVSGTELVDPTQVDRGMLIKDVDYTIFDGGAGTIYLINPFPVNTLLNARQNVTTTQSNSLSNIKNIFTVDTLLTAQAVDFEEGDVVKVLGGTLADDGETGIYEVVPESTGTNDGVNFINMDNLHQLRLITERNKLKSFTESLGVATIASGVINIDLNAGSVHQVTLTENISSFNFVNLNSDGVTTVQLEINQDSIGGWVVNFAGFLTQNGLSPVITADANAKDEIVMITKDAGSTWSLFLAAQDVKAIV